MSTAMYQPNRFSRFVQLFIVAALVAACDSNAPRDVTGEYSLSNAPVRIFENFYVTSASINLRADGTYDSATRWGTAPGRDDAELFEQGTYTLDGSQLELTNAYGDVRILTRRGDNLTELVEGKWTLTFRR